MGCPPTLVTPNCTTAAYATGIGRRDAKSEYGDCLDACVHARVVITCSISKWQTCLHLRRRRLRRRRDRQDPRRRPGPSAPTPIYDFEQSQAPRWQLCTFPSLSGGQFNRHGGPARLRGLRGHERRLRVARRLAVGHIDRQHQRRTSVIPIFTKIRLINVSRNNDLIQVEQELNDIQHDL